MPSPVAVDSGQVLGGRFADVLARARDGDERAFGEIWRETQPMLLRYLWVTAGAQAEDVASQAWLRAIQGLEGFRGDEPAFRRWLETIARNLHVDTVRRSTRRRELLVGDLTVLDRPGRPVAAAASDVAEERMSTMRAIDLVRTLPADQAEMIMLRVVVGLDVAEVAAVTGRTPGAVRVSIHRGLRRLKTQLDEAPAGVTITLADALSGRHG